MYVYTYIYIYIYIYMTITEVIASSFTLLRYSGKYHIEAVPFYTKTTNITVC